MSKKDYVQHSYTINDGRLITINLDGKVALVDTARKESLACAPFEFLGSRVRTAKADEAELDRLSKCVGKKIGIVLGCDLLSRQDMRIRLGDQTITFDKGLYSPSTDVLGSDTEVGLIKAGGRIVFPVQLPKGEMVAMLHLGLMSCYVDADVAGKPLPYHLEEACSLPCGKFSTAAREIEMGIGDMFALVASGDLPEAVRECLGLAKFKPTVSALIGLTLLMENVDLTVSWRLGKLQLRQWDEDRICAKSEWLEAHDLV
jgi:hypothetical protein